MKKAVLLFLLLLPAIAIAETETLNYNQCKVYHIFNDSCLATNCSIPYYDLEVCSPAFPRINQNIVLDENNPIYILPDYNFSVKISESIFQQQLTQVVENTKSINDLKEEIRNLKSSLNGLNDHFNTEISNIRNEMQNTTQSLRSEIITIQNSLTKEKGIGWEIPLTIIIVILIAASYILIKLNIIKMPKRKFEEYETIEPRVEKMRKKTKFGGESK
jgi:hypothetical protein